MRLAPPKGGKNHIIQDITKAGATVRQARKALNAVIDAWNLALSCWEDVEAPGGILTVKVTKGTPHRKLQHLQNIQTKEHILYPVRYPGRRRVVKLRPDPKLDLTVDI
jgi:hypothetical protein